MVTSIGQMRPNDKDDKPNRELSVDDFWHESWLCQTDKYEFSALQAGKLSDKDLRCFCPFRKLLQNNVAFVVEKTSNRASFDTENES